MYLVWDLTCYFSVPFIEASHCYSVNTFHTNHTNTTTIIGVINMLYQILLIILYLVSQREFFDFSLFEIINLIFCCCKKRETHRFFVSIYLYTLPLFFFFFFFVSSCILVVSNSQTKQKIPSIPAISTASSTAPFFGSRSSFFYY